MNKIKVIIVDDDGLVRSGIAKLIESSSTKVEICGEAGDGEQAQKLIERFHPQLVFTDIVMPRINGIELTKWITSFDSGIVTIVLSSYTDFEYVKKAFLFGAFDYIQKYDVDNAMMESILKKATEKIQGNMNFEQFNEQSAIKEFIYSSKLANYGYSMAAMKLMEEAGDSSIIKKMLNNIDKSLLDNIKLFYGDMPKVYAYGDNEIIIGLIDNIKERADILGLSLISGRAVATEGETLLEIKGNADCALDRFFFDDSKKTIVYSADWESSKPNVLQSVEKLMKSVMGESTQNPEVELQHLFSLLRGIHSFTTIKVKFFFISLIEILELKYSSTTNDKNFNAEAIETDLLRYENIADCERVMSKLIKNMINDSISLYQLEHASNSVKAAAIYINRNYADCDLTINKIADEINYSSSYISRQFKTEYGKNLVDYITEIRLQHAKRLIDDGEKRIFRLAESVGYSNYNYFSKVFKKVLGCTPSEYIEVLKRNNT